MRKYSWSILCLLLAGLLVLGACAPAAPAGSDGGGDAAAEEGSAEEGEDAGAEEGEESGEGEADGGGDGDLKFIAVQHAECAWDSFWCTVQAGIEQGAIDNGVNVEILAPDSFDLDKTASLIERHYADCYRSCALQRFHHEGARCWYSSCCL